MRLPRRLLGLRWATLSAAQRAVVVSAAAFVVWFFAATVSDATQFHGVDLRPKVLGARVLLDGKNPYTYDWKPGMSETLLDPRRRHPGPPRLTYSPPLLLFYAPLARIGYGAQRIFWFGAEWVGMLATAAVAARLAAGQRARVWLVAIAAFAFAGNWLFRLHVERGQYYVFVALLLAIALVHVCERRERLSTAAVLGLAIALRPTFGLIPLLLFVAGRRRLAVTSLAAAAAIGLVTLPFYGIDGWKGYLTVVRYHTELGDVAIARDFGPAIPVPKMAEGLDLWTCLTPHTGNVSFAALYTDLLQPRLGPGLLHPLSKGLTLASAIAGAALVRWGSARKLPLRYRLAIILSATFAADFFLAAERHSYVDVMLLPLVALLLPAWTRARALAAGFAVLLLGLAAGTTFAFHVAADRGASMGYWSSWVRTAGILGGAALTAGLALYARRSGRRPPARRATPA